jgi:hypothetical protein
VIFLDEWMNASSAFDFLFDCGLGSCCVLVDLCITCGTAYVPGRRQTVFLNTLSPLRTYLGRLPYEYLSRDSACTNEELGVVERRRKNRRIDVELFEAAQHNNVPEVRRL